MNNCILGKDPMDEKDCGVYCDPVKCVNCGHNMEVHAERRKLLAKNGLTKCADGLERLIIPSKQETSWLKASAAYYD